MVVCQHGVQVSNLIIQLQMKAFCIFGSFDTELSSNEKSSLLQTLKMPRLHRYFPDASLNRSIQESVFRML